MKIFNVRLGLATNSSSTHSIIFLPGGSADQEIDGSSGFGWQSFVCASPQAKRDYLAAAIFENLRGAGGEEIAMAVAKAWTEGGRVNAKSYIDHDSQLTLPRAWDGRGLDRVFVEEFREFLLRDGVLVLGGNDNDSESIPNELYRPDATLLSSLVPEWCMTRKEGAFSCYIDAVEKRIGPSSYCKDGQMRSIDGWQRPESIQKAYQEIKAAVSV